MSFSFNVTTSSANCKLYASASSVLHTAVSGAGTQRITVTSDNSSSAKVRYLTTNIGDHRYSNSIALEIKWNNGSRQEIILAVPNGTISSIVWRYNNRTITTSGDYVSIASNGTITVTANINTSTDPDHGKLSCLTLYGYYVSKKGTVYNGNGTVLNSNSTVGSWNNPGQARHTATSAAAPWTNQYFWKDFDFIPPRDLPNYYIMIAYKGWLKGIGHINIIDRQANSFQDKSDYWDGGYQKYIRYSFYAVYSDGVVPGMSSDADRAEGMRNGSNRSIADSHAIWVRFMPPPTLYEISWVKYSNTNTYLKDGDNKDLKNRMVANTKIKIPNWQMNSNNWTQSKEHFKTWHRKSGSSWPTITESTIENTKVTGNLTFALELEANKYKITYKNASTGSNTTSGEITHGTTITINPRGNLPSSYSVSHIDPSGGVHSAQYSFSLTGNITLQPPTTPANYTFDGWTVNGNTYKAVWHPNNLVITYKSGRGSGSQVTKSSPYKTAYTTITSDDAQFTPPAGMRFVYWLDGNGVKYQAGSSIPANKMTSNITLTAIWGSSWRKVKAIWIYSPTKIDGLNNYKQGQGGYWYPYKPWVNIK